MKYRVAALFMCLSCLFVSTGCTNVFKGGIVADTPLKRWAQAREALTSANDLFSDLAEAGRLNDSQVVQLGTSLHIAGGLLEEAYPPAEAGATATLDDKLQAFSKVLAAVRKVLTEADHERSSRSDSRGGRHGLGSDCAGPSCGGGRDQASRNPANPGRDLARAAGEHQIPRRSVGRAA